MRFYFFLIAAFISCFYNPLRATTLVYEKISGKGTYKTTYKIDKEKEAVKVFIDSKDQTTTIETTPSYELKSFSYKSKKNEDYYNFLLNDSKLKGKGQLKGETLNGEFPIDSKHPWIQEFDFSLRPFLESNKTSIQFMLVNPKTFKIHKMVAKKQGIETLSIGSKTYQAELVTITLQGFKSMFWKALIWYDAKSYDLLMYKSNEGPHTPTTTISLISKTEAPLKP